MTEPVRHEETYVCANCGHTVIHRCCPEKPARQEDPKVKIYIEPRDWWIGYYRGDTHHYVCPLPTVVIRWQRKAAR